jgi:hypothetical protein
MVEALWRWIKNGENPFRQKRGSTQLVTEAGLLLASGFDANLKNALVMAIQKEGVAAWER